MPKPSLGLTVVSTLALAFGVHAETPKPQGVWIWDDGSVGVEFHSCGPSECARIVWLKREDAIGSAPVLDGKNPNPSLRARRVCGIDYITGVNRSSDGNWRGGKVYDFNSGATYDLDIDSFSGNEVKMRGFKGVRMLGANLKLVRPSSPLSRCGT